MVVDVALSILGLVILLLSGDALVRGAVNLALRIGIPALLVSLTIVAFGTSAPELLISVAAVEDGVAGIAIGNVIGSNVANILMVLGVPALMAGLSTSECDTKKTYLMMIGATLLFIGLAFAGPITWAHGLVLLFALSLVLGDAFFTARAHRREIVNAGVEVSDELDEDPEEVEGADLSMPGWKIAVFLVLGLVGLPLGADILVDSAVNIAEALHVPDTVIGLTLVAIGTSLPELATTVMAALRNQAEVALGNVIGSNMFNLLAIIGIASLFGPIPVDPPLLRFDLWVMFGASALLFPFVFLGLNMGRVWGAALTAMYLLYLVIVVM